LPFNGSSDSLALSIRKGTEEFAALDGIIAMRSSPLICIFISKGQLEMKQAKPAVKESPSCVTLNSQAFSQ
jgi:hypothetical protein